ncbi:uncharacterized protein LOC108199113 [Daucus carota subsp. sativus]|uniref:uncharacterized protein LOC108199113 n=1 Tax=Daucus carota subsp. sativus TaxID=79200 RepID=UPI0007EF080F|nr:PREDICTED: uncharacterized protein LOC108199113 [Daucus carota subsp. sativus]
MHNMEDGVGSGDGSSDVIKKKSSSGCLIIKKKGNGVLGFSGSGSKKVHESSNEKKRSRLVDAESESSDELVEPVKRKVKEDIIYERRRSAIDVEEAMAGFGSERKRSGLDVFEFDEYDGFDGKKMRMDYMDDWSKGVGRSGNYRDFGAGASRNVVYRSEDNEKGSMSRVKDKVLHYSGKGRYEEDGDDDDESHLPISFLKEKYREAPNDRIRLQGKNGVLKVMVKKKKQGFREKGSDYPRGDERMGSRSEAALKKNEVKRPAFYSDSKRPRKPVSPRSEKSHKKPRKALPILSNKAEDSETDDSDKSLKLEPMSKQTQRSKKAIKTEHKKLTPTEISTPPSGGKESKVTRGNGTEKQLLREKIRSMLLDRGWRIDYRPRRNRDYLDAVYINPAGTAYWSIIKAYDALQKQLEEEEDKVKPCGESTSSTALPDEIISKLTRQTRKKIERDLKKKKRDAGRVRSAKEVTLTESANGTDSDQQEEKLSSYRKQSHKSLKGKMHEADHAAESDSSGSLYKRKAKQDMAEKESATDSHMIQGRKSKKIGRCTLLVRSSDNGLNSGSDGYVPCTGKRTLLSWLIDSGIVDMSEKVQYMNRRKTRVMLEGWITKDGIHCGCCSKILTISKFEIHAGSKQRQPFPNMFLESGVSLMQCQIDAWNKQEESEREGFHHVDVDGNDPNDDTCGLCGDGGDLICCDGCPSTFHQSCLDIKILPAGDWHCPNCTCKFCGFAGCSNAKANDRTDNLLLRCSLCEKKYHQSCCEDEVDLSVDSGGAANSFCGKNCQEIFSHLQKLLGVKQELESGFSWCLVRRMDSASEMLHLGFPQRVECNSKLAVALSVMDECFLPIVDRRSGINLIHKVLYNCGSNFSRLNYSGFYTVILERGDEMMSVASIRIHGNQLAEMPFIGTRHIYRRQGMCRRLLSAIKSALRKLKVEKLIIPAIAEHMQTWTKNFKFSPLKGSDKQEMRSMNMLVFPRTDMLQKILVKRENMEGSTSNHSGSPSTELKDNCLLLPVSGEKSELDSSPDHDPHTVDNTEVQPLTKNTNKATAAVPALETPTLAMNDIPELCNSLVPSRETKHENSELDSSPGHDLHMTDNTELQPLAESNNKATALFSASETPALPRNDPAVCSSLVFSCEAKDDKSELDSSPKHNPHTRVATESQPLIESSDKATALVSASDTPTLAASDIPAISSSLLSSCQPKHENSQLDTSPMHDTHMSDNTELQPLTESSEKAAAEVSASNVLVVGSSLVSSCEPKHEKSELDLSPEHDPHMGENTEFQPVTESSDKATASVSALETPTQAVNDIPAVCSSLVSSCKSKHETSEIDLSPEHDPHMSNNTESQPLTESIEKAAAVVSASETQILASNDIPLTSSSLVFSSEPATGETFATNLLSDNNLAESIVNLRSTSPFDETSGTIAADNDVPSSSVTGHIQSSDSKAALVKSVDDSSRETSEGDIEEVATDIQNSLSVQDPVSHDKSESTDVDCDINNHSAVDLNDTCEVNVNETLVNPPKIAVEPLSVKDTVEIDTPCETSKANTIAIQDPVHVHDSVSHGNDTAVDLDNTFEVKVSDTSVNSPKDSVEQLSTTKTVEDLAANGTITMCEGGNVVNNTTAIDEKVAGVEPVTDSFSKAVAQNNMSQAIGEGPPESGSETVVVVDERNGDLINSDKGGDVGDVQEVDVKVASVDPIIESNTSAENNTCQTLDESSKNMTSDPIDRSLVDVKSDSQVTPEVASNTMP